MAHCDFENSDFCSSHTVGVAGDDIMFHIVVQTMAWRRTELWLVMGNTRPRG